jgi:hypothetical protein
LQFLNLKIYRMGQMLNRKQLDEAAEQYADACNSAWTNDYDGFIAGADFVLQKLQQTHVSGSLPPIPDWIIKYDQANHQSSAGKAIRFLMERIKELEQGRQ